jgi:hypothetical protein
VGGSPPFCSVGKEKAGQKFQCPSGLSFALIYSKRILAVAGQADGRGYRQVADRAGARFPAAAPARTYRTKDGRLD